MRILIKQRPIGEIMNVCFPWPLSSQQHVMLPVERAATNGGGNAAGDFSSGKCRGAAGWTLLTIDTTPGYTDTAPHPATLTRWTYRAI